MVPGGGLEPPQCHHRRILSPLRLPIPPSRLGFRPLRQVGLAEADIILENTFAINGRMREFSQNLAVQPLQKPDLTIHAPRRRIHSADFLFFWAMLRARLIEYAHVVLLDNPLTAH